MSDIKIFPSTLEGSVVVPPSKSDVHRAIICAALAKGVSTISPVAFSQDILATIDCIKALGAEVTIDGGCVTVDGRNMFSPPKAELDCRESGSTVRFFIPVAAAGGVSSIFTGKGRLPQRPLGVYSDLLPSHGVSCKTPGGLPFEICGKLTPGVYELPGNVSSQFITGLLFALPLLDGDSVIHLTSPLESKGYIDMTTDVQSRFGVEITERGGDYYVKGGQSYKPADYTTEGDWSQASFFMVGAALGGSVTVKGLRSESKQGDRAIADILREFGANVKEEHGDIVCTADKLRAVDIDASQIPDLVPVLAVCAAFAEGETRIYNAQRVRLKESDRLEAMKNALTSCGADIRETEDGLIIRGKGEIDGGHADGVNDHRIVMSMAVAALRSKNGIVVSDKESISKSYGNFFEDYGAVGGKTDQDLK